MDRNIYKIEYKTFSRKVKKNRTQILKKDPRAHLPHITDCHYLRGTTSNTYTDM
jgi:hypothetical protein